MIFVTFLGVPWQVFMGVKEWEVLMEQLSIQLCLQDSELLKPLPSNMERLKFQPK